MQRSRYPAPSLWLTIIPSLLIVATFDVGTSSAADNKPLDFFIPPLIARNVAPIWVQATDSLQIVGGDSVNVHLQVIDPDDQDIQLSTFAMPDFVSIIDSGDGRGCLIVAPPTMLSGRFSMILIAVDDSLAADTVDFTIIVSRFNRAPVWLGPECDSVSIMEGQWITVQLTANDPDGDYLHALVLGAFAPVISTTDYGTFELLFVPEYGSAGSYELKVVVSDLALADSLSLLLTIEPAPPNHPPVWTAPDADSLVLREGELGELRVRVTDEDGDRLTVSTISDVDIAVSPTGDGYYALLVSPDVGEIGWKTVKLIASDKRESDTLNIIVQVIRNPDLNHAPSLVDVPTSIQLNVNCDTTIAVRAIDPDLDDLTFYGFYLPDFVEIVGRPFPEPGDAWADIHISPGSVHQGIFLVYFVASDESLADTAAIWITITNINFWPEIGEIPARTMAEGDTLEIELVASDANGSTVTLSAFSMPTGATFVDHRNNRATFRFIPSYTQAGQYRVGFVANDGSLRDTAFLDVTVLNTPRPPQLVNVASKTVNEGGVIRIPLSATDPDNDPITLSTVNFPEHAVLTDSGNGRGDITFAPVLGQIGPFEMSVIASDGTLADTISILVTVLQVSVPPDSAADVDFITEQVAKYTTSFVVDQIHTEDLNLDGIDEVLFRESVDGGHVLRIWSVAGDSLWALPPVGMGIKSYTLRAQNGLIEPVVWTNGNELLGLTSNRGGWESLATVPDSVTRIQWLPDNPAGALALGSIPYSRSGYFDSPIGCTEYNSTNSSNSLLLTEHGSGKRWAGLGYAQVQPFDFGGAFPVFDHGNQSDLLVFTFSEYFGYEAWGDCGMPHSWEGSGFSLGTFAAGNAEYSWLLNAIKYSCFSSDGCRSSQPNQYNFIVGLGRWNDSQDPGLNLCFAGRPGVDSPYQAENQFRMTVLSRGDSWTTSEVGFNFGAIPSRGGIVTIGNQSPEMMSLAADAGLGHLLTIPDAQVLGRLAMPAAGRFKTGYVLDTTNRDMVFKVLDGIAAYRIKPFIPPRDSAIVHHVPGDFLTIQDAINASLSGDTIIVAPGSYPGSIDFLGKDICLKSSAGAQSTFILPASTTRPAVRFAGGESGAAILDGLTIRLSSTSTVAIENDAKPTVRNNVFREQQGSGDVMAIKSKGALITRNVFAGNTNARCIAVEASGSARIINNTFDRNGQGIYSLDSHTVAINNIITRHKSYGLNGRFAVNDYNDVWQNNPNYEPKYGFTTGPGVHDISLDPELRDPFGDDYRLTDLSYCVDAGDPDEQYADHDGSIADLGAFQLGENPRPGNLAISDEDRWHVISNTPAFTWEFFSSEGRPQTSFELRIEQIEPPESGQIWTVTGGAEKSVVYDGPPLMDGRKYSYTISATDDLAHIGYARSFFRMNSRPDVPVLKSPAEWDLLNYASLSLSCYTAAGVDGDTVCYEFAIAGDVAFMEDVATTECIAPLGDSARTPILSDLQPGRTYWWRARSFDNWEKSDWSPARPFVTRPVGVVRVPVDQLTIQAAIGSAGDGDTIVVSPGEYMENLDFLGKRLLVVSVSGAQSTVIRAADTARHVVRFWRREPKGTTIRGFTLTGSMRGGVRADSSSPGIEECIIAGNRANSHPRSGAGIFLYRTAGSSIVGNIIRSNYAKDYGSAVLLDDCSDDTIAFNVCFDNDGIGDIRGTGTDAFLLNNTIASRTWSGIIAQSGSHFVAINNLVCFAPKEAISSDESSKISSTFHYYYGNGSRNSTSIDPYFVDTTLRDFRLQPRSLCVDKGDPGLGFRDPDGSRADIGALPLGGIEGEPHVRLDAKSPSRATQAPTIFHWGGFGLAGSQEAIELQIDIDNNWTTPAWWSSNIVTLTDTFMTYTGPPFVAGVQYFYRLRIRAGEWSDWAYSGFFVNALPPVPLPLTPRAGDIVAATAFSCTASKVEDPDLDPLQYQFEVYAGPGFDPLVFADTVSTGTDTIVPPVLVTGLASGFPYWWRVRADDQWDVSGWSPTTKFETRAPFAVNVPTEFATMNLAVAALAHGDTIWVSQGLYSGGFDYSGKALHVLSLNGPASTVFDLDSGDVPWIFMWTGGVPGGELSGVTVRGGGSQAAVYCTDSKVSIVGNVFTGFRGSSVVRAGSDGGTLIEGNLFYDNLAEDCIGLHKKPARIINNTFYNNRAGFFTHWPGAVAVNNIVVGCSTYAIWGQFDTADYNLLWDNLPYDGNGYHNGPHDILADPMFVNPAAGDFRLAAGSPCIDAGHPDPQYNDPDGSRNDIGAYPFVPGVSALHPDDHNGDGTVDVRDAVRLIDLTVRKSESGEATGTSDQTRVRELIRRIWRAREVRN